MKTFKIFFLMALPLVVLSCNDQGNKNRNNTNKNKNKSNTTRDVDTVSKGSLLPTISFRAQQDEDKDFLKEVASGGLMEVELGKLAEKNAENPRVKKFGAMMVRDHQKVNDELKTLATSKNVALSDQMENKHRDMVEDLQKKQGEDFDKAYMKGMVEDHEKDVDKFQKVAEDGKDPEVKTFAAKTLPTLLMHLDSAKSVKDALK